MTECGNVTQTIQTIQKKFPTPSSEYDNFSVVAFDHVFTKIRGRLM